MTKGKFGDSKATRQDLAALAAGEKAARTKIPETPPPPRGVDSAPLDHLGPDNEKED